MENQIESSVAKDPLHQEAEQPHKTDEIGTDQSVQKSPIVYEISIDGMCGVY